MKSGWHIGMLRKGRFVKGIVLLFLLHAGLDMVFPQFCSDEPVNIAFNQSSLVSGRTISDETSAPVAASVPADTNGQQPSDVPPRDEDCFCCCTHVMASTVFVNPVNAEPKQPTSSQQDISILSAPPNNLYHPPRFA